MPPPAAHPSVLLELDYARQRPALSEGVSELARYADGTLRVASTMADSSMGLAAAELAFGDAVVQASVALAQGADDDLYGVFLRSVSAQQYYAFAVSPGGHVFVACYDHQFNPLVSGPLDPDLAFAQGLGAANRFQVVAAGPSLTFYLNGTLITAEIVDEQFSQGYIGFFVHHGSTSERAELAAEWIQVRGVFPPG
jgi:hypothetical protein